jgi:hypothetical protein
VRWWWRWSRGRRKNRGDKRARLALRDWKRLAGPISVELVPHFMTRWAVAMRRTIFCIVATLFVEAYAGATEPLPPGTPLPTAAPSIDHNQLALHRYFYVDFPRQLEALHYKRQLAEAEIALLARRLETYRPSRSFGRYGATYTADLAAQIELLAAQRVLTCLRDEEADLWRQRRLIAEHAILSGASGLRTATW